MTPTEEAAKLARQLAEAVRPVKPTQHRNIKNMVLAQQKEVVALFTPLLTAHLAARDEELKRLREALQQICDMVQSNDDPIGHCCAHVAEDALEAHLAALQHKEPNNET